MDVAVVDEIQMIGDRERGWAWTRAVLGLQVRAHCDIHARVRRRCQYAFPYAGRMSICLPVCAPRAAH